MKQYEAAKLTLVSVYILMNTVLEIESSFGQATWEREPAQHQPKSF